MKTATENTIRRSPIVVSALIVYATIVVGPVFGQQPATSAESNVQQAAFTRTERDTPTQAERVTFARQAARVGDQAEQDVGLEMRLTMTMRQGSQAIGSNQTTVQTKQHRIVTTTAVDNGRMSAVKVQYPTATKQVVTNDATVSSADQSPQPQPVQGKTYLCRRAAGKSANESGELIVTDDSGNKPPTDELEIVAQQMQVVGRPNPLAQFLAGRTVAVGDKLELPIPLANQFFNLDDKFGKVTRFTLTLQKVQQDRGRALAVFAASVDAASQNATQMRLEVEGPLVIEAATCRAQRTSLIGPIGMSDSRGSYSTAYQVIGTGKLNMSIASTYSDAKQ